MSTENKAQSQDGDSAHDTAMAAVSLRALSKRFGEVQAVDRVSLEIRRGEFLTLLGPSGSGKTTILKILAGFEKPTEGQVLLEGKDIAPLPPGRRNIGMVFQNYALFPHMSVEENILYPLKIRKWSRRDRVERVEEILGLLRLEGFNNRRPHELSGGQQQRVALGRALSFRPPLLLMDEPLGALDRALRLEMQQELRRIHREVGTTILYVTHDREESLAMSTRIAILREGSLIQTGSPKDLFLRPVSQFVAQFLGECNVWPASSPRRVDADHVSVVFDGRELVVRAHSDMDASGDVRLLLRPSRLRLDDQGADHVLNGIVTDILYLGEFTRITAEVDGLGSVLSYLEGVPGERLAEGDTIRLVISSADLVCVSS